jgi:hypothetical protein
LPPVSDGITRRKIVIAELVSGETDWADFFFLLGVIFAFLAVFLHWTSDTVRGYHPVLLSAAVGCISVGLFLL